MQLVSRFVFGISIGWLILFLWVVTLGQSTSFEFGNDLTKKQFYNLIFDITPVVVLTTLFGTIRKNHPRVRKRLTVAATIILFCFVVIYLLSQMFILGFGKWQTTRIVYEHKKRSGVRIEVQHFDAGALGAGGLRVVQVAPQFVLFNRVTAADTDRINKTLWRPVHRNLEQLP